VPNWIMPIRASRRQRQQLSVVEEPVLLERDEEELESDELPTGVPARCCSGSAKGRLAAAVCTCSRREASAEPAMDSKDTGRKASSGLVGSARAWEEYSEMGVVLGVSMLKWADEAGRAMLK
jgi:hypothetical protein